MSAVAFDVGETLVDEQSTYARWRADVSERGLRLDAAGKMRARREKFLHPDVHFVGSSERWGRRSDEGFFSHLVEEAGVSPEAIGYLA